MAAVFRPAFSCGEDELSLRPRDDEQSMATLNRAVDL
jgi:hypothetical protein